MNTFDEIRVKVRGVMDQPGLAFLEIGSEFTVLRWHTANPAVQNTNRLGLLRHQSLSLSLSLSLCLSKFVLKK